MRGECLYEGAVRAGSVNRRSTRVKVRMKVHLSQLSEFTTLTYLSQDLVAADRGPPHRSRGPDRRGGRKNEGQRLPSVTRDLAGGLVSKTSNLQALYRESRDEDQSTLTSRPAPSSYTFITAASGSP